MSVIVKVDAGRIVNWRRLEVGKPAVLALAYYE